jgi:hypothetical protein
MTTLQPLRLLQGYLRKLLIITKKDNFSPSILNILLNNYIDNFNEIKDVNKILRKDIKVKEQKGKKIKIKQIRNSNFPSEISENIVKFCIAYKYGIMCDWNIDVGDLRLRDLQIEVKGFISDGPSSFGPKENWDYIYFVDCKDFTNKHFTVYEIQLSIDNHIWKSICVNKKETIQMQNNSKRRPRINFEGIKAQLDEKYIKVIWNDNIDKFSIFDKFYQ